MGFSEILQELRKEQGLTHKELAEAIQYSKAIIGFWESQKSEPKASAIIALADFFNVSTDYLLGRVDEAGKPLK
ncbi:MAG: helix-turn-helix domain-containing protein [Clostridiales bacterium]|jgi:transcriptional regulator with XRE-family HTH domain|nr:helix-turn-helix domain-containing protein [Clostridiales bacterium]